MRAVNTQEGREVLVSAAVVLVLLVAVGYKGWRLFSDRAAAPAADSVVSSAPPAAVPAPAPESAQPAAGTPEPGDLMLDEYLRGIIHEETGESAVRVDPVPRIRDGGVWVADVDGETQVALSLNADAALTVGAARARILDQTAVLCRRVFTERDEPQLLVIQWFAPVQNVQGAVNDVPVVTVTMSRETASAIEWASFRSSELPNVADNYVEHVALGR